MTPTHVDDQSTGIRVRFVKEWRIVPDPHPVRWLCFDIGDRTVSVWQREDRRSPLNRWTDKDTGLLR